MSERKLAHIERVVDVKPIEGADKIEVTTVLGWNVVVKKGDVKVGDLCCYIEIDSVVPAIPYFEFLKERKYRVKTIKLRKQISQGLIIPCKQYNDGCILPQLKDTDVVVYKNPLKICREGDDVTSELNITKYESQSDKESNFVPKEKKKYPWYIKRLTRYQWFRKLTGMRSKSFPDWISKTDEERIQNMPWVLTKDHDAQFYVTEKLDGQSATYWYKDHWLNPEFGICSRTVRKSPIDGSNWSRVAKDLDIKTKLKDVGDIAIQGEIVGPSIQGNKYKLDKMKFYVFNIYNIEDKKYYGLDAAKLLCDRLGLEFVPILDHDYKLPNNINDMLEYAKGDSTLYKTKREGVVIRSHDQKVSFKAINNDFLLQNEA